MSVNKEFFWEQKQWLEKAKQHAPDLYDAVIKGRAYPFMLNIDGVLHPVVFVSERGSDGGLDVLGDSWTPLS
jgi:hypothetical protein